jgi:hypothetical protein
MALTQVTGARAAYWIANRPGHKPEGTVYTALVSDLAADDFLCGPRARVVTPGSTVSGVRSLTLERAGFQWTAGQRAADTVMIIR